MLRITPDCPAKNVTASYPRFHFLSPRRARTNASVIISSASIIPFVLIDSILATLFNRSISSVVRDSMALRTSPAERKSRSPGASRRVSGSTRDQSPWVEKPVLGGETGSSKFFFSAVSKSPSLRSLWERRDTELCLRRALLIGGRETKGPPHWHVMTLRVCPRFG